MQEELSKDRLWDRNEIAELINYAKHLQQENEDLQAKIIVMDAYVKNSDAKVKRLTITLNGLLYGERN